MMKKTINNNDGLDFAKITYARAYVAYCNANYKEALNEWLKYVSFKGETEEVKEYIQKINTAVKLEKLEKKEKEFDEQTEKILADGIEKYNFRKWVLCIKRIEELENFASENKFPKAVKYYAKAKEYIGEAVSELSKLVSYKKNADIQSEGLQEKLEYNELLPTKIYKTCFICAREAL
ncbi:MAG: hypothetical protein LBS81_02620 [Endomicrobium sp.]|jgi:hypothetical protein|nr:hypothetical protein [Endomicrobium sp.]